MVVVQQKKRLVKLISLLAFVFFILAIYQLLAVPHADTYEVSVYDALPTFFWLSLIITIFLGQLAILAFLLFGLDGRTWGFGLCVIVLASGVLFFMPLIRGYSIYGMGDVLSHIGFMKDIINTGFVGSYNVYPLDHILGVSIAYNTGLTLPSITLLVPPITSLFNLFFLLLLARQISFKKSEALLIFIFASIPMIGGSTLMFTPNAQAWSLFPFVLYLYFRSQKQPHAREYRALFVLALVQIIFFHPLVGMITIGALAIIWLSARISMRSVTFKSRREEFGRVKNVMLIALLIVFLWQGYAYIVINSLINVYDHLLGDVTSTQITTYAETIEYADLGLLTIIKEIVDLYGPLLIMGILTLISIIYTLKYKRNNSGRLRWDTYHLFAILGFVSFGMVAGMVFVLPLVVGFGRLLVVVMLFSIILVPRILHSILSGSRRSRARLVTLGLCLLLVVLVWLSTYSIFPSPRENELNQQVLTSEYKGMEAFFDMRDIKIPIIQYVPSQSRYYQAINGANDMGEGIRDSNVTPIDHFGYPDNDSISSSYKTRQYLLIDNVGKSAYPSLYPEFESKWRYTPGDFLRLRTVDPGADLLYTSGSLEVYYI